MSGKYHAAHAFRGNMNNIDNNHNHLILHEELLFTFEHMVTLIHQMSDSQYQSMDIYINNCSHLHTQYLEARKILSSEGFNDYIIRCDSQLYYNLQSMILSFKVISNLISNLSEIIKKKQQ